MQYFNNMFIIRKPSVQQLYVGLKIYSLMHIPLANDNPFSFSQPIHCCEYIYESANSFAASLVHHRAIIIRENKHTYKLKIFKREISPFTSNTLKQHMPRMGGKKIKKKPKSTKLQLK